MAMNGYAAAGDGGGEIYVTYPTTFTVTGQATNELLTGCFSLQLTATASSQHFMHSLEDRQKIEQ